MSAVIAVLLIFAVVVALIMAFLFGWATYGSDKGTHAAPRRPAPPAVTTIPVKATASQPPAAITDDAPEHDDAFPKWNPWDSALMRAIRVPRLDRGGEAR